MRSAGGYWYDAKGSQAVPNFGEPQIQLKVLRLLDRKRSHWTVFSLSGNSL
jgi:hypothetical protein